jgi:hypothetical protein
MNKKITILVGVNKFNKKNAHILNRYLYMILEKVNQIML